MPKDCCRRTIAALVMLAAGSTGYAGDVRHVAQVDDAARFRSAATANPRDSDGAYGSAGYVLYTVDEAPGTHGTVFTEADPLTFSTGGFRTIRSIPSYLRLVSNGQSWGVGGFDYPTVDDPRPAPGPEVKDVGAGLAVHNFVEVGQEASVLDIVIGGGFPDLGVRVGVMALGRGKDATGQVRLTQTGGRGSGTASARLIGHPDVCLHLFDITRAAQGDRYTIFLTKSSDGENPNVAYLGLTFDLLDAGSRSASVAGGPSPARARARAGASTPAGDLVERVVKGDRRAAAAAAAELERTIEMGSGERGSEAAKALLGRRAEVVDQAGVVEMLDGLASRDETALAARLLLRIIRAKNTVATYKKGHVAVGQVVPADGKLDPELVLAQMEILPGGYFAGEVGDLQRPIGFRAAGYEALDVPLAGKSGDLVCLGTLSLTPLPADRAAAIRGRVTRDDAKAQGKTTVMVNMNVPKANTPHNGYSPRRRWPEAVSATVTADGAFEAEHLTPGDYTLFVQAQDHVPFTKRLELAPAHETDLGTVALQSSDIGFYIGKAAPATGDLPWEKDFATAARKAKEQGKPLMVMMTATWCGPCKMLEKETLETPWVRYILSRFVIVKAYEDRDVEAKYGLNGYPTLVFTDPEGKEACRTVGSQATIPFIGVCARAYQSLGVEMPPELRELIDKNIVTPAPR